MNDCADSFGEAKVFTALNDLWEYWQVKFQGEEEKDYVYLSTLQLPPTCMPFGLRNAPVTFQQAFDIILFRVR